LQVPIAYSICGNSFEDHLLVLLFSSYILGCCGSWIKKGLLFQTCLLLPDFVIMLIFIIKFLRKPRSDLAVSIGLLLSSMFHSNDDFVVSA
jgi:hypothetical protein